MLMQISFSSWNTKVFFVVMWSDLERNYCFYRNWNALRFKRKFIQQNKICILIFSLVVFFLEFFLYFSFYFSISFVKIRLLSLQFMHLHHSLTFLSFPKSSFSIPNLFITYHKTISLPILKKKGQTFVFPFGFGLYFSKEQN